MTTALVTPPLDALYRHVSALDVEPRGLEKKFDHISDKMAPLKDKISTVQNSTVYQDITTDPSKLLGTFNAIASRFQEHSKAIMNVMNGVQNACPFVGPLVEAFQIAIKFEMIRRDNDKKIILLKSQMMPMMRVLADLERITDPERTDSNGKNLEGRMQSILFLSSTWEERLASFRDVFSKRQNEFVIAMSIHTTLAVDNIQRTLVGIEADVHAASDSASLLLVFRMLESPKERELRDWIKMKGGPDAVLNSERLFGELQSKMKDIKDIMPGIGKEEKPEAITRSIKEEMKMGIDAYLARESDQFELKFNAFRALMLDDMKTTLRHDNDRLLTAFAAGPHDRILDKDIYIVWKDMHWGGNVKARHFIIAVQDHFLHKYNKEERQIHEASRNAIEGKSQPPAESASSTVIDDQPVTMQPGGTDENASESEDLWAAQFITLTRMRPILEAFDDDASGWISVAEANTFTSSRPKNYSVIKWLAFWAAGFPVVCYRYAQAIENVRNCMVAISADVLQCNRAGVDSYMRSMDLNILDFLVHTVVDDFDDDEGEDDAVAHFDEYIEDEAARLAQRLESFGWVIDDNTLLPITGMSRIERHIFPLAFILLRRHLQILQIACKQPLNPRELSEARDSMGVLAKALYTRVRTLASNFRNQNLDPETEFEVAYNGMFLTLYRCFTDGTPAYGTEYPEILYDPQEELDGKILKYPTAEAAIPEIMLRDFHAENEAPFDKFNGLWTGTSVDNHSVSVHMRFLEGDENAFTGCGKDGVGLFDISGTLAPSDGSFTLLIVAKLTYREAERDGHSIWAYRGTVIVNESQRMTAMSGECGAWADDPSAFVACGTFQLTRNLQTLEELQDLLRPEDAEFYNWVAQRQPEQPCVHPYNCDWCGSSIVGARYKCVECAIPNSGDGIDFCEECKHNYVLLPHKKLEHDPALHTLMKSLHVVYVRRQAVLLRWAREKRGDAKEIFDRVGIRDKEEAAEEAQESQEEGEGEGEEGEENGGGQEEEEEEGGEQGGRGRGRKGRKTGEGRRRRRRRKGGGQDEEEDEKEENEGLERDANQDSPENKGKSPQYSLHFEGS
ncbi:EF-hand domain-containing protein [Mycena sanguinolenta]|uniref:EF-hand domain-containing protein n=1 Tax=Mycena sanguinolenta TaxID=230812 RepID=A0A8H6Y5B2_9AGAR|nr:EF-hand domain-containing protein [Mycena sanguinolenta]